MTTNCHLLALQECQHGINAELSSVIAGVNLLFCQHVIGPNNRSVGSSNVSQESALNCTIDHSQAIGMAGVNCSLEQTTNCHHCACHQL